MSLIGRLRKKVKLRSLELQTEYLRKVKEQADPSTVIKKIKQDIRQRVIEDHKVSQLNDEIIGLINRGNFEGITIDETLWQTTIRDKCQQILSQEYTRLKPTDQERLLAEIVGDISSPPFTFEDLKQQIQAKLLADPEVNKLVVALNEPALNLDGLDVDEARKLITDKYEQTLAHEHLSFQGSMKWELLNEIMLQIPTSTLRRVFDGKQFTFIQADKQHPVTIQVDGNRQTYRTPTILSHHLHDIGSDPKLTLPLLHWLSVTTDRKIYRPGEAAAIFIVAPDTAEQMVHLEIHRGNYEGDSWQYLVTNSPQFSKVYEANVPLNTNGLALHPYENLPEGEYTAIVTLSAAQREMGKGAFSTFRVTEYSLSPLNATLVESTSEDDTARIAFPHSDPRQGDSIRINALGQTATLSVLPQGGDEQLVRGLYMRSGEVNKTPLILENAYASQGRLQATVALDQIQVVVFNPRTGQSQVIELRHLKSGDALEFEVAAPYSLFTVGAFRPVGEETGPFEGWGVVIKPLAFEATLTASSTAQLGHEIDLYLNLKPSLSDQGLPGAFCWLLIHDARLAHESPLPKLAQDIYACIRQATTDLVIGTAHSYLNRLIDRETADDASDVPQRQKMSKSMRLMSSSSTPRPMNRSGSRSGRVYEQRTNGRTGVSQGRLILSPDDMVEANPIHMDFPELVYQALFYIEGEAWRTIPLDNQLGKWRIRAYLFQGADYCG